MFLKIMSGQNLPDKDVAKRFIIIEGKVISFPEAAENEWPIAVVDGEEYRLTGNAYILNNSGKTIEAFWARQGRYNPAEKSDEPSTEDVFGGPEVARLPM